MVIHLYKMCLLRLTSLYGMLKQKLDKPYIVWMKKWLNSRIHSKTLILSNERSMRYPNPSPSSEPINQTVQIESRIHELLTDIKKQNWHSSTKKSHLPAQIWKDKQQSDIWNKVQVVILCSPKPKLKPGPLNLTFRLKLKEFNFKPIKISSP